MESEFLFYDEMIVEDFHDELKETKPNVRSERSKEYYKLNISQNNSLNQNEIDSRISTCSNICLSTYLDNLEQSVFPDTLSMASECNEESCSGSSLHQYDSTNDSDTAEDDTILNNFNCDNNLNKFEIENKEKSCHQIENYLTNSDSLKNLKAAIQIKWLDRAMNIKKTFQQKSSLPVDKVDLKSKFMFYGKYFLLTETLEIATKMKGNFQLGETGYNIKETKIPAFVALADEVISENIVIMYKPTLLSNDTENIRNNCKFDLEQKSTLLFVNNRKRNLIRSKSEFNIRDESQNPKHKSSSKSEESYESKEKEIMLLKMKNTSLLLEMERKNKFIEENKSNYVNLKVQFNQTNGKLQMAYEMVQKLKLNLSSQNNTIERLQHENLEIRKENERNRIAKENAENFIRNDQQTKEMLEKKVESFSTIESDYQYLYKAFVDYKNLCQDYDNLQITMIDMENQLAKVSQSHEDSNYQIKYLENEINNYKQQIEKNSQINQSHNHENDFHCRVPCECNCYNHSKSGHSKMKNKKKFRKPSIYSYESDEDVKYVPKQIEQPMKNIVEESNNKEAKPTEKRIDIKEIEKHYDDLQVRKRKLESELCHVPLNGASSRRNAAMGDKEIIENELDKIDHELSSIRRTLKQFKVMGDR